MAKIELNNKGSYEFIDISSELYRKYEWADGTQLRIDKAQWLAVSEAGHRILDLEEVSHFIPFGWIHLFWEVKAGQPHFVK